MNIFTPSLEKEEKMQDTHPSTNGTPSPRSSPLTPCFFPDWPNQLNWEAIAPPGMSSAWRRRLSWKAHDDAFATLLAFLELDGQNTCIVEDEWHARLNTHLVHKPNRHFLFLLVYQHLDTENFLKNLRLEASLEKLFIQWKTKWERDISLTASVRKTCSDKQIKESTCFRTISISEAMTYPTLRTICAEHQSK